MNYGRVSDIEDQLPPLDRHKVTLRLAKDANDRAEDMENCLQRNNVRIVGLPEHAEGRDPTVFVKNWLLELFVKEAFSLFFAVERAHRVPPHPPQLGGPPRSILANCSITKTWRQHCAKRWITLSFSIMVPGCLSIQTS